MAHKGKRAQEFVKWLDKVVGKKNWDGLPVSGTESSFIASTENCNYLFEVKDAEDRVNDLITLYAQVSGSTDNNYLTLCQEKPTTRGYRALAKALCESEDCPRVTLIKWEKPVPKSPGWSTPENEPEPVKRSVYPRILAEGHDKDRVEVCAVNACTYHVNYHGDHGPGFIVKFQQGPTSEAGLNGITDDALLAVLIDHLQYHQESATPCEETGSALTHLKAAAGLLEDRTTDRITRGVEGTRER